MERAQQDGVKNAEQEAPYVAIEGVVNAETSE